MPAVMPVASGGIHAGQMHQLLHYLGEDVDPAVRRRHHRPPDGHRRGRRGQPGRLEAMIKARNEGRDYLARARTSCARPRQAQPRAGHGPRRRGATSPSTTSRPTPPTSSRRRPPPEEASIVRITQGTFSYPARPHRRRDHGCRSSTPATTTGRCRSSSPTTRTPATSTGRCGACRCSTSGTRPACCVEVNACRDGPPGPLRPGHRLRRARWAARPPRCRSSSAGRRGARLPPRAAGGRGPPDPLHDPRVRHRPSAGQRYRRNGSHDGAGATAMAGAEGTRSGSGLGQAPGTARGRARRPDEHALADDAVDLAAAAGRPASTTC